MMAKTMFLAMLIVGVGVSGQTKVDMDARGKLTSPQQNESALAEAMLRRDEESLISALKPKLQQQVVTIDGRTFLDVPGKIRLGRITILDPNTVPKDDAATVVDIEVGKWQSQSLYVRALLTTQPFFGDPPPSEDTPADVDRLRSAIRAADPTIQQCKDGTCKKYCKRDGVWRCCEYGCN
jgi:hypothetical protein